MNLTRAGAKLCVEPTTGAVLAKLSLCAKRQKILITLPARSPRTVAPVMSRRFAGIGVLLMSALVLLLLLHRTAALNLLSNMTLTAGVYDYTSTPSAIYPGAFLHLQVRC